MFRGAITALVTPFKNGTVDEESLRKHIDWQIREGIRGVVPCGTTGESATLTYDEHKRVIDIAVSEAHGRVPVIAGTGSNNTAEAVELTRHAAGAGADAALVITPYYNRPTPDGLVAHYKAVAAASKIPVIAYNVPTRTGTNLTPETTERLAAIPGMAGIKEATGSLTQVSEIIERCGPNFLVISGDDGTVLPLLAVGGHGVISVASNVVPADMAGLVAAHEAGDAARARALHYKMAPLIRALFFETNPIPVKTALALMGRMSGDLRLPLCAMTEGNRVRLEAALKAYGLLGGKV